MNVVKWYNGNSLFSRRKSYVNKDGHYGGKLLLIRLINNSIIKIRRVSPKIISFNRHRFDSNYS